MNESESKLHWIASVADSLTVIAMWAAIAAILIAIASCEARTNEARYQQQEQAK